MRIVLFDLETRKLAQDLSEDHDYGWTLLRAGEGGISALCVYDLTDKWLYLYDDHPLSLKAAISQLENADVVVGYRSEGFDLPCIEGVCGRRLKLKSHIDLYALIARTNAQKGIRGARGDFTLGAVCKRSFGKGKSASGADAPSLAKDGRFGELFNYCGHDVKLTRDLLLHIVKYEGITNVTGSFLALHLPENIRQSLYVWNELSDRSGPRP